MTIYIIYDIIKIKFEIEQYERGYFFMNVKLYYEYECPQVYLVAENKIEKKIKIKVVNFEDIFEDTKYSCYFVEDIPLTPSHIMLGGTELMVKLLRKKIKEIREASDANVYFQNQENAFLNLSTNYTISKNDWDLLDDYYNN